MLSRLVAHQWASRARRGLQWAQVLPAVKPDAAFHLVRGRAGLIPIGESDGAILAWNFDDSTDAFPLLLVRLTEDEANHVYEADPYTEGLLEPVRRHLTDRWAILVVTDDTGKVAIPIPLIRSGPEHLFLTILDQLTEFAVAHLQATATKPSVVPRVDQEVRGRASELAHHYAPCLV